MPYSPEQLERFRNYPIWNIIGVDMRGKQLQIHCPSTSHRDSDPSCTLYDNNTFYCFGCKISGQNAIDYVMVALDYDFAKACQELEKVV